MRGEYGHHQGRGLPAWELPPRARRIHVRGCCFVCVMGTTSACAENTEWWLRYAPLLGNYLRVRGEYRTPRVGGGVPPELPPRARRIPASSKANDSTGGTTSACAENTVVLQDADTGESELPPRARRIRITIAWGCSSNGTTSACAENTSHQQSAPALPRNYLRVRGEYAAGCGVFVDSAELPPRARRILFP